MRDLLFTMKCASRTRFRMFCWIRDELEQYADKKFHTSGGAQFNDDKMIKEGGVGPNSWWRRQVNQYFDRAELFGLDTPQGRQALMKAVTTLLGAVAAMYRNYGEPPAPGYPSGEIHER